MVKVKNKSGRADGVTMNSSSQGPGKVVSLLRAHF